MKLRIKGNSIRLRLSKTDVHKLVEVGCLEEQTSFGLTKLNYVLRVKKEGTELSADYRNDTINLYIPEEWARGWEMNDTISFDSTIALNDGQELFLLVEKDFQCLDHTTEDQSDNYVNPNKTC